MLMALAALSGGVVAKVIDAVIAKGGEKTSWSSSVLDQMGAHMDRLAGEVKDKTQRLDKADEAVKILEQMLAEKTSLLEILEEGAIQLPIPFWVKDGEKRLMLANRAWGSLTSMDPDACVGKNNFDLIKLGLPKSIAQEWEAGDDKAIAAKGELVVVDERSPTQGESVTIGRSGKWFVQAKGVTGIDRLYGLYIDSRMWNFLEVILPADLERVKRILAEAGVQPPDFSAP